MTDTIEVPLPELLDKLRVLDADLHEVSAKRLAKRIAKLWPHLKALFDAKEENDRTGVKTYRFKSQGAGFAGFETAFCQKSPIHTRETLL